MSSFYNHDKIIVRTISPFAVIKLLISRLVLVALIISGIIHFNKNPFIIAIVVILLTVMLLYVGNENIIVYENRFLYRYGSLLKAWTWRRKYYYEDIEQVNCEGLLTTGLDLLSHQLPIAVDPYNKINIVFKDGTFEKIHSRIYKQELKKAIMEIQNQLSKENKRQITHKTSFVNKRL